MIMVQDQMATGTVIGPLTQRHLLPMMAPTTILCGVGRIDFDERSASFFRFARELVKEGRPGRVTDAFGETMIVHHPVDVQIFHTDHPKTVYNLPALLMGEVLTPERDALMDTRYDFAMLTPFGCTLCQFGVLALHLGQRLFLFAEEARVLDLRGIGKRRKGFESHVNTHLSIRWLKALGLTLHREAHVPLARRSTGDRTGFDGTLHGAVIDHFDTADLGEADTGIMRDTKATLREGETIVAGSRTEAREPRGLTNFDATEEGFKGELNTYRDVLQDLGMHAFEGRTLLFQEGEGFLLLIERKGFPRLLIGGFAYFQQVVIEPTALRKCLVKLVNLFLGWVDPVLVGFTYMQSIAQSREGVKRNRSTPAPNKVGPFISRLKDGR
jgi:hypothetical protein